MCWRNLCLDYNNNNVAVNISVIKQTLNGHFKRRYSLIGIAMFAVKRNDKIVSLLLFLSPSYHFLLYYQSWI